jgi:tetratricopeptide (TPR) repeat protein
MPPALFHDLVKVHRAAGAVDAALANADEWANAAKSAGQDLDEYHARFSRVATLAYASRFTQAETELSALASEPKPIGLTVSDKVIELSVLAAIRRDQGDTEAALDAINQATQLARDNTAGRVQADHLAALSGQASQLERDLGHPAEAVERQREAVSAARELGLQIPLARQLHGLASRLIDSGQPGEAAEALEEMMQLTGADARASRLRGDYLQTSGRLALAKDDPGTARQRLTEAIPLLQASGEPNRPDLASAWYNLGTAQMALGEPTTAAASYQAARDTEASIYGDEHPDLIASEFSLAAALHASANFAAAEEAISRCLRIIRRGGAQARIWRDRALILAIIIDIEDGPRAQQ